MVQPRPSQASIIIISSCQEHKAWSSPDKTDCLLYLVEYFYQPEKALDKEGRKPYSDQVVFYVCWRFI